MTRQKLFLALAIYAVLALAGFAVPTRELRLGLWVFLAGIAVKTYIAWLQDKVRSR